MTKNRNRLHLKPETSMSQAGCEAASRRTLLALCATLLALGGAMPGVGQAAGHTQAPATKGEPATKLEAAIGFDYQHSNAPPGGCGCFSLYGGSISGAYSFGPHIAAVVEFAKTNADNVDGTSHELTLTTYLFGAKVPLGRRKSRTVPYAQALVGVARDSGIIAQYQIGGSTKDNVAAAQFGGGLDYRLLPRLSVRVEADYLLTTFPNRADDHQNITRASGGFAYRF